MDLQVFKEECSRLLDRFPELDTDLLNEAWKQVKEKDNKYIRQCVGNILRTKIPGTANVTMSDFELELDNGEIKQAPLPSPTKETVWPKNGELKKELEKRGVKSLWEAVKKETE